MVVLGRAAAAEAEFVRARGAIEQLERQFLRDHQGVAADGVTCADNESPRERDLKLQERDDRDGVGGLIGSVASRMSR